MCVLKPFAAFNGMELFYMCRCRCHCYCCCQRRSQKLNEKTTANTTRIVYLLLSFLSVFRPVHSLSSSSSSACVHSFPSFSSFHAFFLHDAHRIFRLITYYACKTSAYSHLNELTLIRKKECRHTHAHAYIYTRLYPCTK